MDIKPEEIYLLKDRILVDIRSPSEFKEFHIPGAVNLPLFEDEEKRIIGLVYRGEGVERAKSLGYEIAWKKLERLLESFRVLKEKHRHVVVYCWRGGLRSQELCKVLHSSGVEVLRLEGGYRAYRQFILQDMERLLKGKTLLVLTGKTGVGKTRVLRKLKDRGFPVIDLEEIAQDRGSVFGKVGKRKIISQKMFDSLLYEALREIDSEYVFVEDESRTIGNIHLPDALWQKKERGVFIEIRASKDKRLRNILEDYTSMHGWQDEVRVSLYKIRKFLGEEKFALAMQMLEEGKTEQLALFLMEEYYDVIYRTHDQFSLRVDCSDMEECMRELSDFYLSLTEKGVVPQQGR